MKSYDSADDTQEHIREVRRRIHEVSKELDVRWRLHDKTKLEDPEKALFDEYTPLLRETTYGSAEYASCLDAMGPALEHHYAHNRHHPEFFEHGIHDMNLVDVVEMLCDWKAATMRHADGDLDRSIAQNAERFGYGSELEALLRNTARDFGWL